jgi:hypothetical protein
MLSTDAYLDHVATAGVAGAMRGLTAGATIVAKKAKKLAPVRKVFGTQDATYRTRLKSISEIEADRAVRKRLGLSIETTHIYPPSIVLKRAPQMLGIRQVQQGPLGAALRLARASDLLTRRGRFELKVGRAIYRGRLGGRLRSEIHATPARLEGRWIVATIESPTDYAIHQEMGNIHTPAHPYLRPAGRQERPAVIRAVKSGAVGAMKQAAKTGGVRIDIKLPLKVSVG